MTMTFIQVIEYDTKRPEEMDLLYEEFLQATEGKRTLTHEFHTHDRDRTEHYVDIVEFPSYEEAMKNNDLPETQEIASRMRELCSGEPRFLNLEVMEAQTYPRS
jgi:hypothetical protein